MQRRTRDVLIRQRTQIINALRDASGRARVRGGAGQRRVNELRALVTDEAGRNRAAWWPRSSGTRASYIPALASSSPTCRARPSGSSPSTTSAGRASNGSSKARERSSGRGCHAARSPPTLRPAGWSATTASCAMAATSSSRFAVPKELFHEIRRCALPEAIKSSASGAGLQSRQLHADRSSAISRRIWRGGDCGLREKPDGHVFKGDRWEECVQMPGKMARSDPRPPSGLPVVAAVVRAANPPWQNTGYS